MTEATLAKPLTTLCRRIESLALPAAFSLTGMSTQAQTDWVAEGEAGFVLAHIEYALAEDADKSGACPAGMVQGYANLGDVFVDMPELKRGEDEKEPDRAHRTAGNGHPRGTLGDKLNEYQSQRRRTAGLTVHTAGY